MKPDFITDGGKLINRLISEKTAAGCRELRLCGNYEIEETIENINGFDGCEKVIERLACSSD